MNTLQTQLTFFLLDRRILGGIWVAKRIILALTAGSLLDKNIMLALVFIGLREGLSAITDYAQSSNPVTTTNQSSPPNPDPVVPEQKPDVMPDQPNIDALEKQ